MESKPSVGVHHHLSTSQASVSSGTTLNKSARGINENFSIVVEWKILKALPENILLDIGIKLFLCLTGFMLNGNHDCFHTLRLSILVFDRDLRLAVRQNAFHDFILADGIYAFTNTMRQHQRKRQHLAGFVGGVTVNSALIASADGSVTFLAAVSGFERSGHSCADVSALLVYEHKDSKLPRIVADLSEDFAHLPTDIHFAVTGDFARNDDFSLGRHYFAGDASGFIFSETGIQNAVGDEVAQLIRVPHAYTFGGFVSSHVSFSFLFSLRFFR